MFLRIGPLFLPVDIQHTQCPCQFFVLEEMESSDAKQNTTQQICYKTSCVYAAIGESTPQMHPMPSYRIQKAQHTHMGIRHSSISLYIHPDGAKIQVPHLSPALLYPPPSPPLCRPRPHPTATARTVAAVPTAATLAGGWGAGAWRYPPPPPDQGIHTLETPRRGQCSTRTRLLEITALVEAAAATVK